MSDESKAFDEMLEASKAARGKTTRGGGPRFTTAPHAERMQIWHEALKNMSAGDREFYSKHPPKPPGTEAFATKKREPKPPK